MNPISISIKHNFPELWANMQAFQRDIADKATARALNATVRQGEAEMARQISRTYRLKQSDVRQRLAIRQARKRGGTLKLEVVLEATKRDGRRSMNLIHFVETFITLAQRRKRVSAGEGGSYSLRNGAIVQKALQLRFQIRRNGGKQMIPGAFIGNKGRTVFIREGKGRLPIKAVTTIDVVQMFNARAINDVVRQAMLDRFEANWTREVRNISQGFVR